ncbi:MAG: glycine cleavage system protein H [Nitrososphaerota archaeon]
MKGYRIREGLLYTKQHEWTRVEGRRAYLGITDYAAKELTDIVYVSLPRPGDRVKQGDVVATLESVKAVGEVYAPLSGIVLEVNQALTSRPELINASPYEQGWIAALELREGFEAELTQLLDARGYGSYLEGLLKEKRKA